MRWFCNLLTSSLVGVVSACACPLITASDDPKSIGVSSDSQQIEAHLLKAALQQEAQGQPVNRRALIQGTPQSPWAAWQAGWVQIEGQWRPVDHLNEPDPDDKYLALREQLGSDPSAHLQLAKWCRDSGRNALARVHFLALLVEDPESIDAHKFLGHVRLGDGWVDPPALKQLRETVHQEMKRIQDWAPQLNLIMEDLRSTKSHKVTQALDRLDKLDTEAALPALTLFTLMADEDLARPLLRKIAQARSIAACRACVAIALRHPNIQVRQAATDAVKSYSLDIYVPQLLETLASDIQVDNRLVLRADGNAALELVVKQEMQDKKVEHNWQKLVNVTSSIVARRTAISPTPSIVEMLIPTVVVHANSSEKPGIALARALYVPPETLRSVDDSLTTQAQHVLQSTAQANRASKEKMAPIFALLRETTGQPLADEPQAWWGWWIDYNERYRSPLKPVQKSYQIAYEKRGVHTRSSRGPRPVFPGLAVSCLVAGTPVQTSSGLVAIEQIRVGDRVLSQDPESGELSLQWVLLTTLRPPVGTVKIVTEASTIQATGGHLWWVSGSGWTKSRDLQPGMYLHSAGGNVRVQELIEEPELQEVYNLVVDQNHTYFVGPERVLSYDNTDVKPTLRRVPGLE